MRARSRFRYIAGSAILATAMVSAVMPQSQVQDGNAPDSVVLQGSPTREQAEAFAKMRANVLALPRTLPNLICRQSTDRFVASNDEGAQAAPDESASGSTSHARYGIPGSDGGTHRQTDTIPYRNQAYTVRPVQSGSDLKWKYSDTITADVAYVNGSESYSSIALNGRATAIKNMNTFAGLTTVGEFGSDLIALLSPRQAEVTEFQFRGTDKLRDRPVLIIDFRVQKGNNFQWHWIVQTVRLFVKGPKTDSWPGYAGSLWIDATRYEVLRFEIKAVEIEPKFPVKIIEQSTDYGHLQAGDLSDLLVPLRSETVLCDRTDPACHRNVLEFKDWRKFVVKSRIVPTPP